MNLEKYILVQFLKIFAIYIFPYTCSTVLGFQGTDSVEGILLNAPAHKQVCLNADAFSKMKNLRLLRICTAHLPQGLNYLSNELHLLEWHEYPLKSMPRSFQPNNLVELIMPGSHIEQLPEEFSVRFLLMQVFLFFRLSFSQVILEVHVVSL
jgi:hypothetical protein